MNPEIERAAQFAYLAQPIDLAQVSPALMDVVDRCLASSVVYSPAGAWSVPADYEQRPGPSLQQVNGYALDRARVVFAVITGQASLGVPAEVMMAVQSDTPVVLLVDPKVLDRSWFLAWLEAQPAVVKVYTYNVEQEREIRYNDSHAVVSHAQAVQESTNVQLFTSLGVPVDVEDVADFVGWVSADEVY